MMFVLVRTVIFFLVTVVSLRLMGKRQIGELEPTELCVTILISDIATLCLQDINLPVLYALLPIALLVIFEILSSAMALKWMAFREILAGSYSVIIDDGVLDQKEMKRAQLTLDEITEEIRQKGGLGMEDVRFLVLETSGKMSVLLKKDVPQNVMPVPLIADGKILKKNMRKRGISRLQLGKMMKQNGFERLEEVFWLAEADGKVTAVRKDV